MNIDIYKQLHQRILFIEYETGQILKEQTLDQEFGVSRSQLRRDLLALEEAGEVDPTTRGLRLEPRAIRSVER